jgi:hypothetical protein
VPSRLLFLLLNPGFFSRLNQSHSQSIPLSIICLLSLQTIDKNVHCPSCSCVFCIGLRRGDRAGVGGGSAGAAGGAGGGGCGRAGWGMGGGRRAARRRRGGSRLPMCVRSLRVLGRRSSRGQRWGGQGLMCRVSGRSKGGQGVYRPVVCWASWGGGPSCSGRRPACRRCVSFTLRTGSP